MFKNNKTLGQSYHQVVESYRNDEGPAENFIISGRVEEGKAASAWSINSS